MANEFGVSLSAYGNWERGDKEPSLATISDICRILGVTPNWLLGLDDTPGPVPAAPRGAAPPPPPDNAGAYLAIIASQQETISHLVTRIPIPAKETGFPVPTSACDCGGKRKEKTA